MDLDLRQLLQIAKRRWWIVALLMLVAGASAYVSSSRETPLYSASASMLVNPGLSASSSDYTTMLASERLAETYQQMVMSQAMRERVAAALDEEFVPAGFGASAVEGSQIITVTASGTDPESVALVANTVVDEFRIYVQELTSERAASTRAGIDAQIAALQEELTSIDQQIADLNAQDSDEAAVQRQLDDLTTNRSNLRQSMLNLQNSAITLDSQMAASGVQIQTLNEAVEPGAPFSPQPRRSLMLGLFVGALLGAGVVALLEFLDNTVKPESNMANVTGAPLLATVANLSNIEPGGRQVYTMSQPQSAASEAMRLLRTNLEFASASNPIKALAVTSAGPGEGKSTTVANLGVVLAQAGFTTAVLDADLRKPTQNRIFGVDNSAGLTTLLTHPDESWESVAKKVALPGLYLIPSGPIPPNPADLLSSPRFERLLRAIKADVDMVVIDTSPVLAASDALIVARLSDGVMIVAHSNRTRVDALKHAAHSIRQGGIRLVGTVLNRQRGQRGASYYGEYYAPATEGAAKSAPAAKAKA